ncbi:MAG TPA: MFS transporter [Vicinamibacteria bacterium]|nr:MFS transporter [Vicinamibacteria bacterium]
MTSPPVRGPASDPAETLARPTRRWTVLAGVLVSTTVGQMAWASVFPLLNPWIADLGMSRADGGLLFGLYYLPGLVVAIPGGRWLDRIPVRRAFLAIWLLICLGVALMAAAPTFAMLCLGRLVFGAGMNMHHIAAPKLLATWFAGRRELGLVMSVFTLTYTAGVFASLSLLGTLAERQGWRTGMSVVAVLCLAVLAAVTAFAKAAPRSAAGSPSAAPAGRLGLPVWLVAFLWFFYNAGTDAYFTFTPDYLIVQGYAIGQASQIVGLYAWPSLGLKPVFGYFLTPARAYVYLMIGCILPMAAYAFLLAQPPRPYAATFMIGVSLALTMPALVALPTFLVGAEAAGRAYGLCQLFYCLTFFTQPLVGHLIDRTGGHAAGYALMGGYCAVGLLIAARLWSHGKDAGALPPTGLLATDEDVVVDVRGRSRP